MAKELTERGVADAKALVVCVELCTLHVQLSQQRNELLAAALFGDGASACVVGTAPATEDASSGKRRGLFALGACRSVLLPEGERDMTWAVGDTGYELYLSPRIPELLCRYLPDELAQLEAGAKARASGEGRSAEPSDRLPTKFAGGLWAIHPGGRGILDAVQRLYGLSDEQLRPSREVLRRCGNMSSATILFVLEEMRAELEAEEMDDWGSAGRGDKKGWSGQRQGIALAFGPGLTAELQQFAYVPPPGSKQTGSMESTGERHCIASGETVAPLNFAGVPSLVGKTVDGD